MAGYKNKRNSYGRGKKQYTRNKRSITKSKSATAQQKQLLSLQNQVKKLAKSDELETLYTQYALVQPTKIFEPAIGCRIY